MALKTRLIPCLLLKNGLIVRSELFKYHQIIGDPTTQLQRYTDWEVDELVYIDISTSDDYDVGRNDAKIATSGHTNITDIIGEVAKACFAPLTFGGRIRSIDDMRTRFARGADKITINTLAIDEPETITAAARAFGSQAVVVSIDAVLRDDGTYATAKGGHEQLALDPVRWARQVEDLGAGEILLNAVHRDGTAQGYDLDLVERVVSATSIPVVALGGAGRWQHCVDVVREAGASAAAAANIFHFTEMSYKKAKRHMHDAGLEVRLPATDPSPTRKTSR
jgi:cyclase